MTSERRHLAEDSSAEQVVERIGSIAARTAAPTQGPWGYLRPSGVICAADASDVAQCLYDPDAVFIAHARSDIGWLLDQLRTEQAARQALQGRLDLLVAAISRANERLNSLPWQGDGLRTFFADGLECDPGPVGGPGHRGRGQRLGPRDPRAQGRRHMNGGGVGCELGRRLPAGRRRPGPATTPAQALGEGVVAPLT